MSKERKPATEFTRSRNSAQSVPTDEGDFERVGRGFIVDIADRTVRDDARAFLLHRSRRGETPFDVVVVDPPTFSRSAKSEAPWDVERDHAELLALVARNLVPGGVVWFSTNFRRFHLAADSLAADYTLREITQRTIPEDFRDERVHRAWRLVRR